MRDYSAPPRRRHPRPKELNTRSREHLGNLLNGAPWRVRRGPAASCVIAGPAASA